MKKIILTALVLGLLPLTAFASKRECFRYMTNLDRAEVLMQKKCNIVLRDSGNNPVKTVSACFTKLKNQFRGKISYALTTDVVLDDIKSSKDVVILNTTNAIETDLFITIDLFSGSPELFTFIQEAIVYDKLNNTLSIAQQKRFIIGWWNEKYDLELQCQ
jgi:hypothetical protein